MKITWRRHEHCTPCQDGRTQPGPNLSVSICAVDDLSSHCAVSHLCALSLVNGSTPAPNMLKCQPKKRHDNQQMNVSYFKQKYIYMENKTDFEVCKGKNKCSFKYLKTLQLTSKEAYFIQVGIWNWSGRSKLK
jgi:hypothetical protein